MTSSRSFGADRLLLGSPLRQRRYAIVVIIALVLVLLFSVAMLFWSLGHLKPDVMRVYLSALALASLLSLVPLAILRYLDRRERESTWLTAAAFLWGAVIATGLALPLNNAILRAVAAWLRANPQIAEAVGGEAALLIGAPIAGPLVEETTKGLGLLVLFLLLRNEFDNARDGLIYGALIGLGFNWVESALYVAQGYAEYGVAPYGQQLGGRFALFGLAGHALYTGMFGAFLGLARQTPRRWAKIVLPLLGLSLAIMAHAWNNGLGLLVVIVSGKPLPAPSAPRPISIPVGLLQSSLLYAVIFFPFLLLLILLIWRSGLWERRVIQRELAGEVGGAVTPEEYEAVRRDGILRTRRIARTAPRRSKALVNAQHELAFRKYGVTAAGGDPEADPLVAGWRTEIAKLRAQ
ncbi:MAG TPA: PrsW family intramembrane metalloprotease [Roseiflexaceae bacterium]|nr:PrsW family intramembrane metalloprotease [Roseiflexaceae bacterium]